MVKICTKCGEAKHQKLFPFRSDQMVYRSQCKDCHNKKQRVHNKNFYKRNRRDILKKIKDKRKNITAEQKARQNQNHKNYCLKNKDYWSRKAAKKRAAVLMATPTWADHKYINLFYKFAKLEQERTGELVEVDHIIPLKGENVCGLHCEHNLQLLYRKNNREKSNKHKW